MLCIVSPDFALESLSFLSPSPLFHSVACLCLSEAGAKTWHSDAINESNDSVSPSPALALASLRVFSAWNTPEMQSGIQKRETEVSAD